MDHQTVETIKDIAFYLYLIASTVAWVFSIRWLMKRSDNLSKKQRLIFMLITTLLTYIVIVLEANSEFSVHSWLYTGFLEQAYFLRFTLEIIIIALPIGLLWLATHFLYRQLSWSTVLGLYIFSVTGFIPLLILAILLGRITNWVF